MTAGREQTILDAALHYASVNTIVLPHSDELAEASEKYADGKVVTYIDVANPTNRARRTEITVDGQGVVVVHKNTGVAEGLYALAARFNQIDVLRVDRSPLGLIQVRVHPDPRFSPTNPIYVFSEEDKALGEGHGQRLDLCLAASLLNLSDLYPDDSMVPDPVIARVQQLLQT